jgi:poly(A) polymerase Pap1
MFSILSVSVELHNRWIGFVESKIRLIIPDLEKLSYNQSYQLEFRPWPKTYQIASTMTQVTEDLSYIKSDSYFIGIRIKKNEGID